MAAVAETAAACGDDAQQGDDVDDADIDDGSAEDIERRSVVVDAGGHGERLDKLLVTLAGEFSRSHLQALVAGGHVRIDGAVAAAPARRLRAGQRVEVELQPTAASRAFKPQQMALRLLYEDEHLLVVDKPAGLVVHPAPGNWSGTLLNGLLAWDPALAALPRAGIVHRLDKDTSGLMVVARSLPSMTALVRALAAREVHREYVALAHGEVAAGAQRFDAPIGRDPRARVRMTVLAEARGGRAARTDAWRLALGRAADGRVFSALRCKLHSGRTHQIRVHLAAAGHPLLADALYGGAPALGIERQALHAHALRFAHPLLGHALRFEAPPPADFETAWRHIDPSLQPRP